jgi:hypothetical protein
MGELRLQRLREALLPSVLFPVFAVERVCGEDEDGFDQGFAEIAGHDVHDGPLNSALMLRVVLQIDGIEWLVFLGSEEGRSPPAIKALQFVPLGQPLSFQVEEEDDLLLEVQLSLVFMVVCEAFSHQDMDICALGHCF